jgi:hypothetical protein
MLYVWAPVSVLHYDATEGKINAFGTAVQGNVALVNARGVWQCSRKYREIRKKLPTAMQQTTPFSETA